MRFHTLVLPVIISMMISITSCEGKEGEKTEREARGFLEQIIRKVRIDPNARQCGLRVLSDKSMVGETDAGMLPHLRTFLGPVIHDVTTSLDKRSILSVTKDIKNFNSQICTDDAADAYYKSLLVGAPVGTISGYGYDSYLFLSLNGDYKKAVLLHESVGMRLKQTENKVLIGPGQGHGNLEFYVKRGSRWHLVKTEMDWVT